MPSRSIIPFLLLLMLPLLSQAQYTERMSIGGGKHYFMGNASFYYKGWDSVEKILWEKNEDKPLRLTNNWAAYFGTFFPVVTISENSMLSWSTEFMVSIATLTYDSLLMIRNTLYLSPRSVYKVGGMFALEYRMGGDVSLEKADASLLTFGVGVNPCVTSPRDQKLNPIELGFIPFAKAELGFFMGVAVKVRGILYFGKTVYVEDNSIDVSNLGVGDRLKTHLSGNNGFDVAIMIMPFSRRWR